jgi:magnesium transporter
MSPGGRVFRDADTVGAAAQFLATGFKGGSHVYVADQSDIAIGSIPIATLAGAPREACLGPLSNPLAAVATADMDQEHVAALAADNNLSEMPVIDAAGRLIGIVTPQTIIAVARQEHVEDMHKLAGIVHQQNYAAHALELSPWRRVRDRLPWLMVGLAGSALAAFIMAGFETTLSANLQIAFFVPGIVYLADAIGTQTEAVAVRGLSLSHAPLGSILIRELSAGLLIGLILAAIAAPAIAAWSGSGRLAFAVSVSIVAAGGAATSIGLLLPWLLSRMGYDPAFGSGPVATVIQDVLSLVVYFTVVLLVMPGKV